MATVLLDTNALLWAVYSPERLPQRVSGMLQSTENEIVFSAVSIWEIAVKRSLRKRDFTAEPRDVLETSLQMGFVERYLTSADAIRVMALPLYHHDPFDRMLVAQAVAMPARLVTSDRQLASYSELVDVFAPD